MRFARKQLMRPGIGVEARAVHAAAEPRHAESEHAERDRVHDMRQWNVVACVRHPENDRKCRREPARAEATDGAGDQDSGDQVKVNRLFTQDRIEQMARDVRRHDQGRSEAIVKDHLARPRPRCFLGDFERQTLLPAMRRPANDTRSAIPPPGFYVSLSGILLKCNIRIFGLRNGLYR